MERSRGSCLSPGFLAIQPPRVPGDSVFRIGGGRVTRLARSLGHHSAWLSGLLGSTEADGQPDTTGVTTRRQEGPRHEPPRVLGSLSGADRVSVHR